MRLLMRLASLFLILANVSCGSMRVADVNAFVTLPYSEDGFGITLVSRKETRIPKEQWDVQKKKGIIFLSEDYKVLRQTTLINCQYHECKQIMGAFDELFLRLDEALQKIPVP